MNVFDLRGPEFLSFYLVLLIISVPAAVLLRWLLRGPHDQMAGRLPALNAFQVAYLNGRDRGVVEAAVSSLVHRGSLKVSGTHLKILDPMLRNADPIEIATCDAVASGYVTLEALRERLARKMLPLARPLEQYQLVVRRNYPCPAQILPGLLMLAVFAVAVTKIFIGISRGRPVGFLIVLSVPAAIACGFMFRSVHRTGRGDRFLTALKSRNAALRETSRTSLVSIQPADLAMAVGLYGASTLAPVFHDDLHRFLVPPPPQRERGWFDGSGSSCSSSACGGGGCGGGGCGGGCGGCGS